MKYTVHILYLRTVRSTVDEFAWSQHLLGRVLGMVPTIVEILSTCVPIVANTVDDTRWCVEFIIKDTSRLQLLSWPFPITSSVILHDFFSILLIFL